MLQSRKRTVKSLKPHEQKFKDTLISDGKIGIAITARNRSDFFPYVMEKFQKFKPASEHILFVSDDCSDGKHSLDYYNITASHGSDSQCQYMRQSQRQGIARNKNKCIEYLYDRGCQHFFLFDEDAYPIREGWDQLFINAAKLTPVHHMMFNVEHKLIRFAKIMKHVTECSNCQGVLLYFTRTVVDTIGGFDSRFDVYGYEHANFSKRSYLAGLHCGLKEYIVPNGCDEYIESIDLLKLIGKNHEFMPTFRSSMDGEDVAASVDNNARLLIPDPEKLYCDFRS
jgi:hypothetical protein